MPLHEHILEFRIQNLRDKEAFGEYYQLQRLPIYRFILTRTASHEIAEDLTSEVFLKACTYIFEERRQVTHLRGLLFTIARGTIIDYFRRIGKHEATLAPDDPFFMKMADHGESAENTMESKIAWERVWKQLQELRREYSEVITLRFLDGLAVEEIAVVLGKSHGAVRVLLHRALRTLEKELENRS